MDQRLRYEQTISSKLDALPIPDMADAIWSRIEKQLDIDMPSDDGPSGSNGPQSPSPRIIIGGSAFVIIIAFISIFLLRKNNNQDQQLIPNTTSPEVSTEQTIKPPGEQRKNIETPLNQVKQLDNTLPVVMNNLSDSSLSTPSIILPDSNNVLNNALVQNPLPVPPKIIDTVQKDKKKRGVSGISDNDYRIVPRKDSSK